MNCETQNAAICEPTQQELDKVSGGARAVSAVVGVVNEVAKEFVQILSTGAIGGLNESKEDKQYTCAGTQAWRDGYFSHQLKLEFLCELVLSQGSSLSVLTQLRSYRCT